MSLTREKKEDKTGHWVTKSNPYKEQLLIADLATQFDLEFEMKR